MSFLNRCYIENFLKTYQLVRNNCKRFQNVNLEKHKNFLYLIFLLTRFDFNDAVHFLDQ